MLLLDEADVYLAERSLDDLKRNGIVSGRFYGLFRLQASDEDFGR